MITRSAVHVRPSAAATVLASDEPGVAGLFDEIDSGGANVIGEPFAFIQIVFLAAGGADFINGTTIECDGGMLLGVLYDVGLKTITDLL